MPSLTTVRSILLSTLLITGLVLNTTKPATAGEISEEKLNTERSLKWGGEGLPLDDVLTVRDPLVNSIVGKVTIDRHGEDNSTEENTGFLSNIFNAITIRDPSTPKPGRMAIVTLWGSKEEGCFVTASIHNAPKNNDSANDIVPVKMEIGLGTQVVKLTPVPRSTPKTASGNYTYNDGKNEMSATRYFSENTFAINGKVADLFRNAPKGNARVRITFANGSTKIFPIGEKNVARWKEIYSYNPTCTAAK